VLKSESRLFSVGVEVWSPKFSNPGVGVGVPQGNKDSTSLAAAAADDDDDDDDTVDDGSGGSSGECCVAHDNCEYCVDF